MHASAVHLDRVAPSGPSASGSAVTALFVYEHDRDMLRVALPRPEIHVVARVGSSVPGGLDVHVLGAGQTVHRKRIGGGQRTVMARLRLGTHEAVLGAPAAAIAGRVVALADLWGSATTRRLLDRLEGARDTALAAVILEGALAERFAIARRDRDRDRERDRDRGGVSAHLALAAAERLPNASVTAVALELRVSERHLRRVFRETVGVSPKTFARLTRFHRALRAAREDGHPSWASIAAGAGYYDQAHLIAEFRAIAGVTPRALLGELRAHPLVG